MLPDVVLVAPPTLLVLLLVLSPPSVAPTVELEAALVSEPVVAATPVLDTSADEVALPELLITVAVPSGGSAPLPQPAPMIPTSER